MSDSLRERAERRVDIKIKFYRNLKAYVIVNAVLVIINWLCKIFVNVKSKKR